ncbi:MAG: carboxylesterase/lipase family protein [Clostridia bacterium]|nr:carboxylesterase/lipase family protein [Clostridia bacterium]
MKKLFTIDDIMVSFISALGYGFGATISKLLGWPELVCQGASFLLGMGLNWIITKIAFSKAVQKKPMNRVITYVAVFLIFLAAHTFSVVWMGTSMFDYLGEQLVSVVGMPILGFFANLLIRWYQVRKIRERYGDGSEGYVFDLKDKDIEEVNKQNQQIFDKYDASCAVKTRTGVYVGAKYKKTMCYLGIPYAKPPVDGRRWKAPEPLPDSDEVFEAQNFGASAIQVEHKGSILQHHRQSEDCLTLNIGVGLDKKETRKPVLVLFHHGDFTSGGSADPLLYGYNFVSEHPDVVFVSFNYRLGIFGFIDFSEVPGGEACPDTLNLGLLDQIAALKWIKENIAAFGGDPENITVAGFESGASSIVLLAASGQAKGLFQRAFVFDGSPSAAYDTPDTARALAKNLLKETGAATMSDLLGLKTEPLKDAAQKLWQNMCSPTCDGTLIPADVYQACKEGAASGIEFIIGIPNNEMRVLRSLIGDQKYADGIFAAVNEMRNYMDDATASAVQAYIEAQTASSTELEAKSKLVEQWHALCIYRGAARLKAGGNKVHLMYWAEKTLIENLGSGTVDVAAALLGNGDALQMYGSVMNADLAETLQSLLVKFMNGDALQLYPNEIKGVDAIEWKPFPKALVISDGKLQCDLIDDRITEVKGLLDFVVS